MNIPLRLIVLSAVLVAGQLAQSTFAAGEGVSANSGTNLALARQLNQAFIQVADQVSPSVVVITVTEKASASRSADSWDDDDDFIQQLRRFFREHDQDSSQLPSVPEKTTGEGSGIIIRKDGYILTNHHVVEDAEKIEVRLQDGRIFKAEVRGVDIPADVAVIKIDAANLPVAKLADSSKTRVGEFAIAVGAPFALDYSVTFGHVSAKDRSNIFPGETDSATGMIDQNFIQTDANINPGNSGGPLVNIEGEVIGVNTLIRGLHTGIGFAIPINLAKEIADKLISDGKFTRSWLGISVISLREYPKYRDLLPGVTDGVVVREISSAGPAAKSNLRTADIITAIDGKTVLTAQQLKDAIRSKSAGSPMALDVFRKTESGSKLLKVSVTPVEWVDKTETAEGNKTEGNATIESKKLGLNVSSFNLELSRKYNLDKTDGVIVTSVDKNGLAAQNGILEGDVITQLDERPVKSARQFREILKRSDPGHGVILQFISNGVAKFEVLKEGGD